MQQCCVYLDMWIGCRSDSILTLLYTTILLLTLIVHCVYMQRLLKLITLEDVLLQDYAAGCIRNIRLLAVANEQADMAKARARAARAQQKRQKPRHGIVNVTM